MQTVSSANRTCIASESAVECTATVLMPISWKARWIRSAISPRLAIRSFWIAISLSEDDERLVELHRLTVRDDDLLHGAGLGRDDRVHHLHRLDDQQGVAGLHGLTHRDEGLRAGLRRHEGGADDGRFHGLASDVLFLRRGL